MICIINIRKRIYSINSIFKIISRKGNMGNENLFLTLHYDSFRFVSQGILFNTSDGMPHQVVLK